ncbi:hypothetical protein HanPSC8_Chr01g0023991 [Helianthus annuus]|nr:hypothetical protein HanPSC8_Chr01g0023991 [Helianthus annuus]
MPVGLRLDEPLEAFVLLCDSPLKLPKDISLDIFNELRSKGLLFAGFLAFSDGLLSHDMTSSSENDPNNSTCVDHS